MDTAQIITLMLSAIGIFILLCTFFQYLKLRGRNLRGLAVILTAVAAAAVWCGSDLLCFYLPAGYLFTIAGITYFAAQILFYTLMIHFIFRISVQDIRRNRILMSLVYIFPVILLFMAFFPATRHLAMDFQNPDGIGYTIEYGRVTNIWIVYHNIMTMAAIILAIRFELKLPKKSRNLHWVILVALVIPFLAGVLLQFVVVLDKLRLNIILNWIPPYILCYAFFGYLFTARPIALDSTQEMYVIFDLYGVCVDANKSAKDFFRKKFGMSMPTYTQLSSFMAQDTADEIDGQIFEMHDDKDLRYYKVESFPISNGLSRFCGNGYIMQEVTEWLEQVSKLTSQANMDVLTGAYNRRFLEDHMPKMLARDVRGQMPITVFMIDIDHFKNVNDTYGHPVGDEVLTTLSDLCRNNIRPSDIYCRYGGEEFLIFIESVDEATGKRMAERICKTVNDYSFNTTAGVLNITVSIGGLTLVPTDTTTIAQLIDIADRYLYIAKSAGRNQVAYYNENESAH